MELKNVGPGHQFPQWRVLYVIPNHEKKVAIHLLHRSVEYFLPLYSERSRWSDRNVTLERPLFPGYVFVCFARESRQAVISSPGVIKVLGNKGNEVVDAHEIERIRAAIATGCLLRPHPPITLGTRCPSFQRRVCWNGRTRDRAAQQLQSDYFDVRSEAVLLTRSRHSGR